MAHRSGRLQNIKIYAVIVIVTLDISSSHYNAVKVGVFNDSKVQLNAKTNFKYILQWSENVPFVSCMGQMGLTNTKCSFTNCFITSNKKLLGDYINFDVIAFSGPDVTTYNNSLLPQRRSPHQKYVFASMEPSYSYPVNSKGFDGFFNWTWTYKLNSDIRLRYFVVQDMKRRVIGPNIEMHWKKREQMLPVSKEILTILRAKNKTAVGFIEHCTTSSKREEYITELNQELVTKYNLYVDIYGRCGKMKCSDNEECSISAMQKYYFFLAFEKTLDEDFVTDTLLLQAINYTAIPIVYGGANYTRFLPEGSYLNARSLDPAALAATMNELIHDLDKYKLYFKWTNHYMYQSTIESKDADAYCQMCALLNDEEKVSKVSVCKNFSQWWNHENHDKDVNKTHVIEERESIQIPGLCRRNLKKFRKKKKFLKLPQETKHETVKKAVYILNELMKSVKFFFKGSKFFIDFPSLIK